MKFSSAISVLPMLLPESRAKAPGPRRLRREQTEHPGKPSHQYLIDNFCSQFDCSAVDRSSLKCTPDETGDQDFIFGPNQADNYNSAGSEVEDIESKSKIESIKEERSQKVLSCVCCDKLSTSEGLDLDTSLDEDSLEDDTSLDGSERGSSGAFMGGQGRPQGGSGMFSGRPSEGQGIGSASKPSMQEGGSSGNGGPQSQSSFRPGLGQGSGRPQGSGMMGGQGSGRPQGSGMMGGQGGSVEAPNGGQAASNFGSKPGQGQGNFEPGSGGSGTIGSQGGSSSTGQWSNGSSGGGTYAGTAAVGTADCSGVKLVQTVSGKSTTCEGSGGDGSSHHFHLWPVDVSTDYCHGWSGISSRDGKEHVNSANNIRCSPDGRKLLYTQYAGSIDCTSVLNPNGVEKEFVLGECHQGIPPTLYDMGTNLDCCLDPAGDSCRNQFTGTPGVPESDALIDAATWMNGEKCGSPGDNVSDRIKVARDSAVVSSLTTAEDEYLAASSSRKQSIVGPAAMATILLFLIMV